MFSRFYVRPDSSNAKLAEALYGSSGRSSFSLVFPTISVGGLKLKYDARVGLYVCELMGELDALPPGLDGVPVEYIEVYKPNAPDLPGMASDGRYADGAYMAIIDSTVVGENEPVRVRHFTVRGPDLPGVNAYLHKLKGEDTE
jgi:hypothetical protein